MDHGRNGFGDSSYLKNEGYSNTFEIQSDLVPHAPISGLCSRFRSIGDFFRQISIFDYEKLVVEQ